MGRFTRPLRPVRAGVRLLGQQRFEARLLKVTVASEGFREALILHHNKGNAVVRDQ